MKDISARRGLWAASGLAILLVVALYLRPDATRPMGPVDLEAASELELPHVRSSRSPKNQGDDAQARYEYEMYRLRDTRTGLIPAGIREKELAFVRNLPRADELAAKTGRLMAEKWSFRGPRNVGGRTRALAIDLGYNGTTNRRILAGGISGGIYLSEDDGASWTLTTSLADLASVSSLAQDPSNHDVWYFGTGEFLGNSAGGGLQQFYGHGIFKSVDGGHSWTQLQSTVDGSLEVFDNLWDYVWNLAVHPNGTVFAATYGGIYRSTDGGTSWTYVLGRAGDNDPFSAITDVAIGSDGAVYAGLSRNGSGAATYGIFKSTDVGNQWQNITPPDLATDPYRITLGPAPSNPNVLYVLAQTDQQGATSEHHQLFKTTNGGGAWTNLSASVPNEQGVSGNASFSTQGGYDQIVRVKPDDANAVFIGGTNLYRSVDGGSTFTRIGGYASAANYAQFDKHHSDQHSLAFFPTNTNMAVSGHDGGLSRSNNILATPHSWTSLNNGYVTTQFYAVAMDPQPGGLTVVGGLQDNGTWASQSADASTDWFDLFGGDGAYAAVAPGASALYVSAQNGVVYRITSTSFANIGPAGAERFMFINPFILDPNDPRVMYMGENGGVWRNSNLDGIPDGGQEPTATNWTFLNASARAGSSTTTIAASKTPANRIYFGSTDYQTQSAIVRIDDVQNNVAGTVITPPVTAEGFPPFPSSIAVNPQDGDEVVAVFSNYNIQSIWHSTNAGASWTNIDGNLGGANGPSVRSAAIVPTVSGTMYFVGTSTGIYSTLNPSGAGTTWALEGGDVLGNLVVDMLAVRPEDGVIVAGTHGRGVYQATIGQGGAAAVASLNVSDLQIDLRPGTSRSTTFTVTNTGAADLEFAVGAVGKADGAVGKRLQEDPTLRLPSAEAKSEPWRDSGPRPVEADAELGNSARTVTSAGDFLVFDDGSELPDDFLGWGDGLTPFQWGSRFSAPVGGFALEAFYVYMRSENAASLPIEVFVTSPEGEIFVSGSVELPASTVGTTGEWYYIQFENAISFAEGEAFDIEIVAPGEVFFPAGVDFNAQVPGTGFYWVNAGFDGWYVQLSSELGYENGAWLIRAEGTAGGTTLNMPPTASITASTTQAAVNQSISFDGSASRDPDGTITAYAWNFGDGTTANQATAQHAYASPGSYTVVLTVTDDEGATGQASTQINVASDNNPPVAHITASKIQAEINEAITFDASGSTDSDGSVASYAWTFGDGGTSTEQVATHAFTQAGSYNVQLTVTDDEGATDKTSIRIDVLAEPSRLTVTPLTGRLAPGESQVITVTYDATSQVEGTYTGQVNLNTNGGNFIIPVTVLVSQSVGSESVAEVPEQFALEQNFPNPFNPETTIRFTLDHSARVRLTVFDVVGRVARPLVDAPMAAGSHQVLWDGRDARGRSVASGTYLYRLEAWSPNGELAFHTTRKMILVK